MGYLEDAGQRMQFVAMQRCQPMQVLFSYGSESHLYLALVLVVLGASDQSRFFAACDQRHYTVMLRLQAFSQFADAGPFTAGKSFYMQHHQILQRRQAFALGGFFAEADEAAQLITEFRQGFEIVFFQAGRWFHWYGNILLGVY